MRDDLGMSDYNRYCPISMGSDVIADRWTPLIVRELVLGNTRFNDIARGLPGISRSLLVRRLNHLERAGVIERWPSPTGKGSEYLLTSAGRDLEQVLVTLGRWSVQWLYHELRPREIDAQTLMWWMHRLVVPEKLPTGRVVVEFRPHGTGPAHDLDGDRPGRGVGLHAAPRLRLRSRRDESDDLPCRACSAASTRGPTRSPTATSSSRARPRLAKALPTWFQWGLFGPEMRAAESHALAT